MTSVQQHAHTTEEIRRHVPGEPGLWVVLFGDMTMFAILFGIYLHVRGQQPDVFAASQEDLNQNFGAINTILLLSSSLLLVYAINYVRRKDLQRATSLLLCTIGLGLGFVVIKLFEYHEQISDGHTPDRKRVLHVLLCSHRYPPDPRGNRPSRANRLACQLLTIENTTDVDDLHRGRSLFLAPG